MDGKKLLEKMELIDPGYIEEADSKDDAGRKPLLVMKRLTAALAACIVIMLISGTVMLSDGGIINSNIEINSNIGSIFGSGAVSAVVFGASLLAVIGISAAMISKKNKR